jgi:regulator of RNase E activity RraA
MRGSRRQTSQRRRNHGALGNDPRQAQDGEHRHDRDRAVQARLSHPDDPERGAARSGQADDVGEAFTLRYLPAREDLHPITVFQDRGHPQRKGIEDCPPGAVFVIDSRKDARAASAGSILVTRLMKRGVAGIVTDGGFRDAGEIARLAIPSFHQRPSAPTNLTLHQAVDTNVPIACGDAPVWPGDLIVGDADGCIVIPAHLADEIADEAVEMTAFEDFVFHCAAPGCFV